MTATAKLSRREGGGALDCRPRDLVLMEDGVTWAGAVATCALQEHHRQRKIAR